MAKQSLMIPSRNEPLLEKMVEDTFAKATGEIEIIVVLDGPTTFPLPKERSNLIFIKKSTPEGLRPAINDAAKIATGKYIMKSDAHVGFGPGFDEIMQKDMEDNWISIPRRYDLDPELWQPRLETVVDYYYFGFPWTRKDVFVMGDMRWFIRAINRKEVMVDDLMTYGGTVWFTSAEHFHKRLKGMNSEGYGTFAVEQHELGLKTWLGGGRVVVNKNTWYAHFGQMHQLRPYPSDIEDNVRGCVNSTHFWTENKWKDRIHDFDWLVEKFWPLPTITHHVNRERYSWPDNWRDYYEGRIKALV